MAKYTYDKTAKIFRTPGGQRMTVEMVLDIMNGKWGRSLRKINVDKPGILSVKRPKQQSVEDFTESLRELADDVLIRLGVDTILIGVEDHSNLYHLDEEAMGNVGWMKKENCYMTKEEADEYIADYHGEEE